MSALHKKSIGLNFAVPRIHMLSTLQLIVMYMCQGPLYSIPHLYLYGSHCVTLLGLDGDHCVCFNTLEARIIFK
jgi:hypothetical protein